MTDPECEFPANTNVEMFSEVRPSQGPMSPVGSKIELFKPHHLELAEIAKTPEMYGNKQLQVKKEFCTIKEGIRKANIQPIDREENLEVDSVAERQFEDKYRKMPQFGT